MNPEQLNNNPEQLNNHIDNNNTDLIRDKYFTSKKTLENKDKELEYLRQITSLIATKEKEENGNDLPIDINTCRLDMEKYKRQGIFRSEEVEGTIETIEELRNKFFQKLNFNNINDQANREIIGEKMELLVLDVLYKFLKDDFIVVRSSEYDDIDNGVDTIVFDKNTGDIICTFDEGSLANYDEKVKKITEKNQSGGARLKYGLSLIKDKEGKQKIRGNSVKNVPLFYVLLDYKEIQNRISNIENDLSKQSEEEKILFIYIMTSLKMEIEKMKNPSLGISGNILDSVNVFKNRIEKNYPNIFYSEPSAITKVRGKLKWDYYLLPMRVENEKEKERYRVKSK